MVTSDIARDDVTQHALQPVETMKPGMVVHVVEVVSMLSLRLALCPLAASIPYLHTFSAAGLGVDLESMSGISRWLTSLMPSGASVLAAAPFLLFLTVIESRQRRCTEWLAAVGRMGISVLLLLVGDDPFRPLRVPPPLRGNHVSGFMRKGTCPAQRRGDAEGTARKDANGERACVLLLLFRAVLAGSTFGAWCWCGLGSRGALPLAALVMSDHRSIESAVEALKRGDYHLHALIHAVVQSAAFQTR